MSNSNKIKMIFIEDERMWYEQTYFICLCFAFWFFLIPLFVGVISLILHYKNNYLRNIEKQHTSNNSNAENINTKTIDKNNNNSKVSIPSELLECDFILDNSSHEEISLYRKNKTNEMFDDYIVFDIETTGFSPEEHKIIEISAIKYNNNEVTDTFNFLVNPQVDIPSKISKLTGITNEDIKNCDTINIILPKFINFIESYPLVAHNGSFDFSFIEKNLKQLELPLFENKNIDTLYLARKSIPNLKNYKLETLKEYFNLQNVSHRALSDCETTNTIYQFCKNKNLTTRSH